MLGPIVRSCISKGMKMSVYRDPRDGRWRYRARVPLPNGKRERISGCAPKSTNTKAAAEHAERLHVLRVSSPGSLADMPTKLAVSERKEVPTLKEFAERFLDEYLPRQKPNERKSKERILRGKRGLIAFFGPMRLGEIDQSHVNAYVTTLKDLDTKTINNRLSVLSTLLAYAGPKGCKLIPASELSFHIDSMDAEIVAVPREDVTKLIDAATDQRYRVAVLLAAESGLRIGEIRGVQWTDIKSGRLTIRRSVDPDGNITPPKHNKSRVVPLSQALEAALAKLPRRGIWIVSRLDDGGMLGYWALLEAVHALYKRAGVAVPVSESGRTMPWHSLRHSFGTDCAARGVPLPTIKELMGHVDIHTTMRYVTVSEAQLDSAIERAFGAAGQQVANKIEKRA